MSMSYVWQGSENASFVSYLDLLSPREALQIITVPDKDMYCIFCNQKFEFNFIIPKVTNLLSQTFEYVP